MKRWELGKSLDCTEYFNQVNTETQGIYKNGYFFTMDVWCIHVNRIQVGVNSEYETEEDTKIMEREEITKEELCEALGKHLDCDVRNSVTYMLDHGITLKQIVDALIEIDCNKGFESYDVTEYRYNEPLESLFDVIDGGYGIEKFIVEESTVSK